MALSACTSMFGDVRGSSVAGLKSCVGGLKGTDWVGRDGRGVITFLLCIL